MAKLEEILVPNHKSIYRYTKMRDKVLFCIYAPNRSDFKAGLLDAWNKKIMMTEQEAAQAKTMSVEIPEEGDLGVGYYTRRLAENGFVLH